MSDATSESRKPWAEHPIRTLHACVETLASAFRGYLPWMEEQRDSVVRGHQALIEDTVKRADACMVIIEHGEKQREAAKEEIKRMADDARAAIDDILGFAPPF